MGFVLTRSFVYIWVSTNFDKSLEDNKIVFLVSEDTLDRNDGVVRTSTTRGGSRGTR